MQIFGLSQDCHHLIYASYPQNSTTVCQKVQIKKNVQLKRVHFCQSPASLPFPDKEFQFIVCPFGEQHHVLTIQWYPYHMCCGSGCCKIFQASLLVFGTQTIIIDKLCISQSCCWHFSEPDIVLFQKQQNPFLLLWMWFQGQILQTSYHIQSNFLTITLQMQMSTYSSCHCICRRKSSFITICISKGKTSTYKNAREGGRINCFSCCKNDKFFFVGAQTNGKTLQ